MQSPFCFDAYSLTLIHPTRFAQCRAYGIISPLIDVLKANSDQQATNDLHGDVLELADRHDLGSCAERREGSIPSVPTLFPLLRAKQ